MRRRFCAGKNARGVGGIVFLLSSFVLLILLVVDVVDASRNCAATAQGAIRPRQSPSRASRKGRGGGVRTFVRTSRSLAAIEMIRGGDGGFRCSPINTRGGGGGAASTPPPPPSPRSQKGGKKKQPPKGGRDSSESPYDPHQLFTPPPPAAAMTAGASHVTTGEVGEGGGDFGARLASTVVMIGLLTAFLRKTGEDGFVSLVVFVQAALYSEATNVIFGRMTGLFKWYHLLTYLVAIDGKILFPNVDRAMLNLVSFLMTVLGVGAILWNMNSEGQDIPSFRNTLSEFVGSHFTALLLVGAASFFLRTAKDYGMRWVLYPAALVIVNDTMGYLCGSLFGKTKLLSAISPKKTWEGFVSAAVFTMALSRPLSKRILGTADSSSSSTVLLSLPHLLLVAAYISFVAPWGGFCASTVKRAYGAKDFGKLIPGHGGLLDRLDCHLFTAPFVYLFLQLVAGGGASGGVGMGDAIVPPPDNPNGPTVTATAAVSE